jgi:hypothetical protein
LFLPAVSHGADTLGAGANAARGLTDNPDQPLAANYAVQLGAFRQLSRAESALAALDTTYAEIVRDRTADRGMYVIILGRFASLSEARAAGAQFAAGNPTADYWVRPVKGLPQEGGVPSPTVAAQEKTGNDASADRVTPARKSDRPGKSRQASETTEGFTMAIDELWGEYDYFPDNNAAADHQEYVHGQASANWLSASTRWEMQLAGRVDGYFQQGAADSDRLDFDYAETFIRYLENNLRVTAGAQIVPWGRIDEFPPTDRLSTQDISRYILDDLEERRRASTAVRVEYYAGNAKLDVLVIPYFRAAELPAKNSVWFPVNQRSGEVFGLKTTSESSAIIKNATIDLDEPDSEGGVAVRYSGLTSNLDYGITVQRGRQTLPYFVYNAAQQSLETDYPRTWILGGDIGMEALGGTFRFEFSWLSDTPVTSSIDGRVSNVSTISWGGGYEFFPGDGDARINLQLMGNNLFDASRVLDRTEIYSLNGSFETPFANETWRFRTRFHVGLDENDFYLNPEITYTGWPSQELYLETHYFEGSDGTPGGFHQDHSLIGVGWRQQF